MNTSKTLIQQEKQNSGTPERLKILQKLKTKTNKKRFWNTPERHGNARMLATTKKTPLAFRVPKIYIREKNFFSQNDAWKKIYAFKNYLVTLGYQPQTRDSLPLYVNHFFKYHSNITISSITENHILNFYEYLQQKPHTHQSGGISQTHIHKHLYALRLFFDFLEKTRQILNNPMSGLHFPSPAYKPREALTQQEINALYSVTKTHKEKAILGLFYGCGLRKSEAEKLEIKDIHFRENMLYVRAGKGKKRRAIPLSERILEDFKKYLYEERPAATETAFMLNKLHNKMLGERYYRGFKEILFRAIREKKLPESRRDMGLHNLRHSIATHLLGNGMQVEYVRDFLGHEFLDTTKIYTHINKEQLTSGF